MYAFSAIAHAAFTILRPLLTYRFGNTSTIGKECTYYVSDETGSKIKNIPYHDYMYTQEIPVDSVTVKGLSEKNSPEENTSAIQYAVNSTHTNGGGTVCIPPGTYKISTLTLKSNVTLFIPYGCELRSLTYTENKKSILPLEKAVIKAENCENISVIGGGTINGEGVSYTKEPETSEPNFALEKFNLYLRVISSRKRIRPPLEDAVRCNIINFKNCRNIRIENICLKDSAVWTLVLTGCDNVRIKDTVIDDHMHVANTDGIDICGGKDIMIEHCFIASGDDGVVLKPIESEINNVTVQNCTITSFANCFKIGTETQFDVSNITVKDCCFFIPDGITQGYSAIAIESCDGANIKNILVSDINIDGISSIFLIWLGNRLKYKKRKIGSIDGITLKNINADNIELPCAITGCKDKKVTSYIKNIKIENIKAQYRDTQENLHIRKRIGEYTMNGYPEITRVSHIYFHSHKTSRYWDLPCFGLCLRHTENVDFSGLDIKKRTCSNLPFLYCDDVK